MCVPERRESRGSHGRYGVVAEARTHARTCPADELQHSLMAPTGSGFEEGEIAIEMVIWHSAVKLGGGM